MTVTDAPTPPSEWGGWGRRILEWWNSLTTNINDALTRLTTAESEIDTLQGYGVWIAHTPTITNGPGAPTVTAAYTPIGSMIVYRVQIVWGGAAGGAGALLCSLPVTAHSSIQNTYGHATVTSSDVSAPAQYHGEIKIEAGGTNLSFWTASAAGANAVWTGLAIPYAPAAGDIVEFTVIYRT